MATCENFLMPQNTFDEKSISVQAIAASVPGLGAIRRNMASPGHNELILYASCSTIMCRIVIHDEIMSSVSLRYFIEFYWSSPHGFTDVRYGMPYVYCIPPTGWLNAKET